MLDQIKESLASQDNMKCRRLRRSLSSASIHISRSEIQQLYNSLPRPNVKSYQLPTISSTIKATGKDGESFLPPIDSRQEDIDGFRKDDDNIRLDISNRRLTILFVFALI